MTGPGPTNSRGKILGNIRKTLVGNDLIASERLAVAEMRIRARKANTVPGRAGGGLRQHLALFVSEAQRVDATTVGLSHPDDLPDAVMAYLSANALPARIKAAPHALLQNISWPEHPALDITYGPTAGDDVAGLSVAFAAVAETGTLVLHSGSESPTTLNFLPDHHLVVLPLSVLVGTYEEAWTALRTTGNGAMPRTVNWVTGPSRTADIEQTLLMGAHGPRSLHILILDDKKDS